MDLQLLRELAPHVLGAVMRRYRDFYAAEDAVQEALLAASIAWPRDGMPENPRAWLIQVAYRRLTDEARAESARRRREEEVARDTELVVEQDSGGEQEDDALVVLFMCCHPALSPTSAIALTLRAVGGLGTVEIAKALLVPVATMGQRISRAKETIRESGVPFERPSADEWSGRLASVLHVLYLIFNEGYAATVGPELGRPELASEAIRLARMLHRWRPDDAEASGLLALMLLTDARRAARTNARGEAIPLDEQDRSRWDHEAIRDGAALVTEAMSKGAVGPYQLQAAIASLHAEAKSFEATDWPQILALYGVLERMTDNPIVTLNKAVALAMVHGPRAGLEALRALDGDARMKETHRLDAVRAHLHERAGDVRAAIEHYERAAKATTNVPEQRYLRARVAKLSS